jgi:hypothetical protein
MAAPFAMCSVVNLATPPGPVPDGLKITAIQGPDTGASAPNTPALAVGSFIFWPMSYYDNRVSMNIVVYDPKGNVVGTIEKPGARYVYKTTLQPNGEDDGTVTFWGQANQSVTLTFAEIIEML